MPQVSDKFGPIYATATLDGSGNGQVSFQAQGANIRITNLFVKASTSTNQAICSMYKNYVSDSSLISSTNSGSTGAAAHGAIDLFDGETVIARWTGGDSGATATATFVGIKLPFSDRPTSEELTWDDPIAAGDGSLIYPALKSPNFQAGVSGWSLNRDGNLEVNDITARGTFEADGVGNSYIIVEGNSTDVRIRFRPPDIAGIPTANIAEGDIRAVAGPDGVGNGTLSLQINSPRWAAGAANLRYPTLYMNTAKYDGSINPGVTIAPDGGSFANFNITLSGATRINQSLIVDNDLTVSGSFSRPNCLLSLSQSITSGSIQTLSSPGVIQDSYGLLSGSTVTLNKSGTWEIGIVLMYQAQATAAGFRQARFSINGTDHTHWEVPTTANFNNTGITVMGITRIEAVANDQITFQAFQNSGATLNVASNSRCWVQLHEG